ncbi:hypothetical protein [Kineococcus glutinatus]|uniref:hypothetical protein n=1 Tax=Kineococcus glutinatus TaxID=1070872 RepID=UPI0031EC296E
MTSLPHPAPGTSLLAPTGAADPHLGRRRAGAVAATLTAGVACFQLALAAGAPWGRLAWGGVHAGVLPDGYRLASAASALTYAALTVVAGTGLLPAAPRRAVLTGAAALMGVGTVLNLASPSLPERLLWTPVAAALAVTFWRARPAPAR